MLINKEDEMSKFIRVIGVSFCVLAAGVGIAQAAVAVPEIDPGMASNALSLLACGVLILVGRFIRK